MQISATSIAIVIILVASTFRRFHLFGLDGLSMPVFFLLLFGLLGFATLYQVTFQQVDE